MELCPRRVCGGHDRGLQRAWICLFMLPAVPATVNRARAAMPRACAYSPLFDHAATEAAARIAGRIGLEIVGVGMHDQTATDDAIGTFADRDAIDRQCQRCLAVFVRREIAEVTRVAVRCVRRAVLFRERIEVAAGAHARNCPRGRP